MKITLYDIGYYDGYLYVDPKKPQDGNYIQGWLQGGSDGLAGLVPEREFILHMTSHLLIQQGQSSCFTTHGACAYRGGQNRELRCAAGLWIRDDDYRPDIEDKMPNDTSVMSVFPPGLVAAHHRLLRQLQSTHDAMPRGRPWSEKDKEEFAWRLKFIQDDGSLSE